MTSGEEVNTSPTRQLRSYHLKNGFNLRRARKDLCSQLGITMKQLRKRGILRKYRYVKEFKKYMPLRHAEEK